jgi:2-C-methyl-D-erythritol 4-phosphate cytidylyltransferase
MGAGIPKQFILLGGKPILMRTIEAFYNFDNTINIILTLPKTEISEWQNLCKKYSFNIKCEIVEGGKERFYSVKNALECVPNDSFTAIQDGVRPFTSRETIERCFNAAELHGNAIPVLPIEESVRIVENEQNSIINRAKIRIVQTPQVFNSNLIKRAYQTDFSPEFTDDASVLEKKRLRNKSCAGQPRKHQNHYSV